MIEKFEMLVDIFETAVANLAYFEETATDWESPNLMEAKKNRDDTYKDLMSAIKDMIE